MTESEASYCLKAMSEHNPEVCEECPLYGKTGTDHCSEDAIRVAIDALEAKEYGTKHLPAEYDWIPFEMREMDEEEKSCNGVEEGYILDCPLPDEDEEILVTYANGTVDVDTFMRDGNECYLDSGNDLVTEAIAWRKKPAPYQKGE